MGHINECPHVRRTPKLLTGDVVAAKAKFLFYPTHHFAISF
jgi:hypothetical protein